MTKSQRKAYKAGNKVRKEKILEAARNLPKNDPWKSHYCSMNVGQG